ncbi:metalloendopeptidase OMA1, mitochondrial isoform X2 [Seriola aureovittata]|uniref:metalloendopeptidase OMA1, mitochondrial isoform X2 n=1 Tax=Seriola aureovittata TaxID=2871759 RepID=UPI0024BE747D|nr:metalloendopeptidase OMA1, mitochondrial isoform X2 [Seriola aureovittata]
MVLLSVGLFRSGRFCSHLTRHEQVCARAGFTWKKTQAVSCGNIGHRAGNSLHLRAAPSAPRLLFCGRGPKPCFQISPKTASPLRSGPVQTRFLHTSAPLRALPAPFIWMVLKPLQKLVAIILGRSLRKWWVALPDNRRQLMRQWAWQRRWPLAAGAGVAMVIAALLLLTHLDESPVTGRTRLLVFSRENYMELAALTSQAYMEEFAELLVPVTDPRHKVVERVVQHLAQRNKDIPEMSDVTWSVHVVQSPNVNAFVLPNGEVFMFTGMLDAVADIHQLTFVLGHEMAHALLGHSAEEASLSHVVDLLSLILLTAIWAVCPRDSLALLGQWVQEKLKELMFNRPYSRKLEAEADRVGLHLAAKACADVRASPVFWQRMELIEQLTGESAQSEWLSTHPSHRNRFAQLDGLVPQVVQVLMQNAKDQGRGGSQVASKPHLPHSPASLPAPLSAALLAQTAPPPSPSVDQESGGPVPDVASAPVPAPTEGVGPQVGVQTG